MRVVIVDGDVSYPATSGKRLRTLNLMLQLATTHEITYVARSDHGDPDTKLAREYLEDHGIRTELIHDPLPVKKGVGFYARLGRNLLSPLPYSVASHQSQEMRRAVNRIAAEGPVDLWQCEWSGYLSTLRDQLDANRLCMAHNVDALIWQRYYEVETNPIKRLYVREQWRKFLKFERKSFRGAARVVAVSDEDAALMRTQFGVDHVDVVDNGIDCRWLSDATGVRRSHQYLFLGALDWRPNQDAVRWLLDEIVPSIRQLDPKANLVVVGRNPPAWMASRIRGTEGVELHANVPDVRPYLAESQLMVVPLRIGGGSRLKILESLATGLPVVSTSVGAEGLRLKPDSHYLQADSAATIADSVVRCLKRPHWALALGDSGKTFVHEHYDWSILAKRLDKIWTACVEHRTPGSNATSFQDQGTSELTA